jgi:outer membrane receptor protein involved in Fe transport
MLALASPALLAQEQTTLGEVLVTAQKRTENLQDVPISVTSLNTETLEQLHVQNFADYVQFLPSVASQPSLGSGSGFSLVYMRGVATGTDGQATTSQPSVGMYLDEQPITTIQGNLDVHLYDIARVEALAGPQGTLYGASSQAGTIRIITNKPDPSGFAAGYSLEGNMVDSDDTGYVAEGFVNLPIGENAAIRLVGWSLSTAGWIDNVERSRTFGADTGETDDDITVSNAEFAEDNYNTVETTGGRAALRINLNEDWTVTPVFQAQKSESRGSWGDDISKCATIEYIDDEVYNEVVPCPAGTTNDYQAAVSAGEDNVSTFTHEFSEDKWYQVGLTIEGKMGNFDVTYAGNYLNRDFDASFDYSDYSYWYDSLYTTGYFSGLHFENSGLVDEETGDPIPGDNISPVARYANNDQYTKESHELRISSPQDRRVRGLLGFFYQKQDHDFEQHWLVAGLADMMLMNQEFSEQFKDTVYLNSMDRIDKDKAVFGQLSFDLTDDVELTLGARYFEPETTVNGFFGFGLGFNRTCPPGVTEDADCAPPIPLSEEPGAVANGGEGAYVPWGQKWSRNGEWRCPSQVDYKDAPCQNVIDRKESASEWVGRVNLSWKATDDAMLYATWSEGYRPGGPNRNPFTGDYVSDFLTNWEAGWKTQWLNNRLQFNGAVFLEQWDDTQVAFLGQNGITTVANATKAEIIGTEMEFMWLATNKLRLSAALAYYDAELKDDFFAVDADGNPLQPQANAPKGTSLPVTPDFKANLVSRYEFALGNFDAHWQSAVVYTGSASAQLDVIDNAILGDVPSSTVVNSSFGIRKDSYSVELFVQNVTDENAIRAKTAECTFTVCGYQAHGIRYQPRTVGIRFSQEF